MQQNRQRRRVRRQDNDLTDAAVESLSRFVRAFLQLAIMGSLLDEIEDFLRKRLVRDGPGGCFVGHLGGSRVGGSVAKRR